MVNPFAKKAEPPIVEIVNVMEREPTLFERIKAALDTPPDFTSIQPFRWGTRTVRRGNLSNKAAHRMNRDARNEARRDRVDAARRQAKGYAHG